MRIDRFTPLAIIIFSASTHDIKIWPTRECPSRNSPAGSVPAQLCGHHHLFSPPWVPVLAIRHLAGRNLLSAAYATRLRRVGFWLQISI
jgi:hypothetical protein